MFDISDFVDTYEPDEILKDVDCIDEDWYDDDLNELSFEDEKDAAEGFALLASEVDSQDELFEIA